MSVYYFLFFMALGTLGPYLNLHYQSMGVTGTQLGLMAGTATMLGLVLQPMWGFLADRAPSRSRYLALLLVAAGAAALLLSRMATVPLVMGFGILYALINAPAQPVADSIALAEASRRNLHFSRLRLWGAVGWIVATGASGWVYDRTTSAPMFFVYAAGVLVCAAWTWRINEAGITAGPRLTLREAFRALSANRLLAAVLVLAFIVQASWSVHMLFLPLYLRAQGAPDGLVGLAFSIGAMTEIPIFFFIGKMAARFRPATLLVVSSLVQGTLYFLMSLNPAPEAIVAINMLSGVYWAVYFSTIVTLVGDLTPEGLKATGQGLLGAFTWGLGGMVGTIAGGRLIDLLGYATVYRYLIGAAAVGVVGYSVLGRLHRR